MIFKSLFSGVVSIGFSGSREPSLEAVSALQLLLQSISPGIQIYVCCARGIDAVVRANFHGSPHLQVFSVSEFASLDPRAALAARSARCVESVDPGSRGLLVAVPSGACPPDVRPSRSFSGKGSGTWGSVALAAGLGRRCLVWLPESVSPPSWFGFEWSVVARVPSGSWWLLSELPKPAVQLSLF